MVAIQLYLYLVNACKLTRAFCDVPPKLDIVDDFLKKKDFKFLNSGKTLNILSSQESLSFFVSYIPV